MITPHVFDIALRVPFRGLTRRSGIVFEGPAGWGEWSPFSEYSDAEAANWLRAAQEAATVGFAAARRPRVEVNGIVPALPPVEAARRAVESRCRTVKIKVAASTLEEDEARVAAVREALPDAKIRIDANGGWSLRQASIALSRLQRFALEYAEQPCATVADLAELRRRDLGVPIAADESIRRVEDPLRVRDAGAADVAVLKVQPLGGVTACLRLAAELGMPVVISSAVETSVGLAAGAAAAAALPEPPLACGLETGRLLAGDLVTERLLPDSGSLPVRPIRPSAALLVEHAAGADVTRFWLGRWHRVRQLLEDGR